MTAVRAIVIGASAGGLPAVLRIFQDNIPAKSPPIILVFHRGASDESDYARIFKNIVINRIKEAEDKEIILNCVIYIAPAGYHLLVERDFSFSLSIDEKVKWARPSIDVLFESAAEAYKDGLMAIVLTGANDDGADGLKKIEKLGGQIVIQSPETAAYPEMPRAAIDATVNPKICTLQEIKTLIKSACNPDRHAEVI